jgi:hypothetical protein
MILRLSRPPAFEHWLPDAGGVRRATGNGAAPEPATELAAPENTLVMVSTFDCGYAGDTQTPRGRLGVYPTRR